MKVLIVDDEAIVRLSLRRAFQSRGHEVVEASDGLIGLALWREFVPDLAVLDVLMPGLTGPNLLKEIGTSRGETKVMFISAHTGEYSPQKAHEMGADLFISKPFDNIFSVVESAEGLVHG